jgi:diketogulonate reductase-like aldo/keto reductase
MNQSPTITLHGRVDIPQLGFGMWRVNGTEASRALATALEVGYRHIDTAKLYGNEEDVGRAVRGSGIPREEVFVTTKVWNDDQGYDEARRACEASLRRLGLDYVDLYLIHWPSPGQDKYVETWRALEQIQRDGLARAIGVSNFTSEHLRRLAERCAVLPAINQVELHPTLQQAPLRAVHAELGIVTESWRPLGKGRDLAEPVVVQVAERVRRTPAQVVLRWHLQSGFVTIPKSVTPSRIRENFEVFDFELGADDMAALAGLDRGERLGPHPDR